MLIKSLYTIEINFQKLVSDLVNKLSKHYTNVFSNPYKNDFYFINKTNFSVLSRNETLSFYRENGFYNYGWTEDYYYDCHKNTFVRFIKGIYYHVYDYHTLIKIISGYINDNSDKKISIAVDIDLFRLMLTDLRKQIYELAKTDEALSYFINLYQTYNQVFDKFKFYLACYDFEAFKYFYKNFTIGISYNIDVYFDKNDNNISKDLAEYTKFVDEYAKTLFDRNLKHVKFVSIDSYNFNELKQVELVIALIFKMNNLDEIIKISILQDLHKFL